MPAGTGLPPKREVAARLERRRGVGAGAPELVVGHQLAPDLAALHARARVGDGEVGQADALLDARRRARLRQLRRALRECGRRRHAGDEGGDDAGETVLSAHGWTSSSKGFTAHLPRAGGQVIRGAEILQIEKEVRRCGGGRRNTTRRRKTIPEALPHFRTLRTLLQRGRAKRRRTCSRRRSMTAARSAAPTRSVSRGRESSTASSFPTRVVGTGAASARFQR